MSAAEDQRIAPTAPDEAPGSANGARRTSVILRDFVTTYPGPQVRLADLVEALGDRTYGLVLLVLALPNIVTGVIPFVSTLFGIPQVLIAAQMVFGWRRPRLPRWALERAIARDDLHALVTRALPTIERIERLVRPRYPFFTSPAAERWVGAVALVLAVLVSLPIPLGNFLPSIAIVVLALGILEKDGIAVAFGVAASLFAVIFVGLVGAVFVTLIDIVYSLIAMRFFGD